ncbi:hypothetical protein QA584_03900 [Anaerocolumna sp. AGMB13025]|uniref:hypothetical protein n=1 Tax=Anaerocolumna sp. AGMB13025 TaxID=3039116 RepID=UPI00241D1752|nr:hypothetical protein [Anaerocolumna sp. AGMB13025]WFR58220.1 hypothetical protein QA584_03900 [Anaerocolumna sp. AGMB13025]
MSKRILKRITSLLVIFCVLVTSFTGCAKKPDKNDETTPTAVTASTTATTETAEAGTASGETKTIRWGTHWLPDIDPNYKDPTTGEYTMDEASRQASMAALQAAKEQLNVEVQFVQYATDTRSELLTSVLAGNPVCDIAVMWGGSEITVLGQNILQPLDQYADLFSDPEYSWMFYDKIYGHNYFLTAEQNFIPRWPLMFNATLISKVDSLKDSNGKTIYPTSLYNEGKWTFSTFKDYLNKISAYYANTKAPEGCLLSTVQAYESDHRMATLSSIFAAGGGIYGSDGLEADSEGTIKGVAYIKELMDAGIYKDCGLSDDEYTPRWCQQATDFQNGGSVFTDMPDWWISGVCSTAADRGESIGIVPWPRPDDMATDDPAYQQVLSTGNSMGILKGISEDQAKLCMEFLKVYYGTYYKTLGGVDSVTKYKEAAASAKATGYGYDIFNEEFGDELLQTFTDISVKLKVNNYAGLLGYQSIWENLIGKSFYGIDGSPSYDVAIKANKDLFTKQAKDMEAILATDDIRDNVAPDIKKTKTFAFPAGTDPSTITFSDYVTCEDAVDGILDATTAKYDYSSVDFAKTGTYDEGLKVIISDKSENEGSMKTKVIIFNPDNKKAPVIITKKDYRTIKVDEDASAINWKDDFIESAADVDGIDIKENITADISSLDTTTPGEYEVIITAADFAGNSAEVKVKVTVAAE